jgi:hypothetical protein
MGKNETRTNQPRLGASSQLYRLCGGGSGPGWAWSCVCDAELQSRNNVRQELAVAVRSRVEVGGATVRYCTGGNDTELGGKAGDKK